MNPIKELFGLHKRPEATPESASDTESDEAAKARKTGDTGNEKNANPETVDGDRGVASVSKIHSVQSRMSNYLALGLIGVLGFGMLSWYYSQAWVRQQAVKEQAHKAVKASAAGDLALPPLGKVEAPVSATPAMDVAQGGIPPLPAPAAQATPAAYAPGSEGRPIDHRLEGPVFEPTASGPMMGTPGTAPSTPSVAGGPLVAAPGAGSSSGAEAGMDSLLKPAVAAAVRAKVLSNQPLLLPKGAFIDCTLETAIDSALPGLTTCITATDTFGADGKVVLLERGTKLVGETKGDVRQGTARIFVLWSEARTPTGVVVPLSSPGTDELGRSGLPGTVDRHFMDRFGAALLISVIEGAVQAAAQPKGGGAVIYNPTAATDVVTEVLKSTVNIPPTVRKQNGDRIQILVARDLDFRSVYELHARD